MTSSFSEHDFYLAEFRGRSLAIALPGAPRSGLGPLEKVLVELGANETRVVLLSHDTAVLVDLAGEPLVELSSPRFPGEVWRRLRERSAAPLRVPADTTLAAACRIAALRLGLAKVVILDPRGGLRREDGSRLSYVDLETLRPLNREAGDLGAGDPERQELMREVRAMLEAGVPAVNLCEISSLADELFTYSGSGTMFTRQRYTQVRALALDEFDAAHDLVQRGVREGYLVERSPQELDALLGGGFGVFVEGRYLAGIGALLPHDQEDASEIASLYTLTRFLGEGVGAHLIRYALERADRERRRYVFACTTSERVETFFLRSGFRLASPDEIPDSKWRGYSPERRARVRCLRFDLAGRRGQEAVDPS